MAAKKFYLTSTAPAVDPVIPGEKWDDLSQNGVSAMSETPAGASVSIAQPETSSSGSHNVLLHRWVSPEITQAGTLVPGGGFWYYIIAGVSENSTAANIESSSRVFVIDSGGNLRGVFMSSSGGDEFPVGSGPGDTTGHQVAPPDWLSTGSSVNVQPGDRVVLELGYEATNTSSTQYIAETRFGGTGADLAIGDSAANGNRDLPPHFTLTGDVSDLWVGIPEPSGPAPTRFFLAI